MGRRGPLHVDLRPPPRWCWGEIGPYKPTLKRPLRGKGPLWCLVEQMHPDQCGPPGGVLTAERKSRLHGIRRHEISGGVAVTRNNSLRAVAAKSLEQAIDRRERDPERPGDLGGRLRLLPTTKDGFTDWNRKRTWHDRTSQ
jgi:hypothetical protein